MFGHFHLNVRVTGIEREKVSSSLVSNQQHCHEACTVTTWLSIPFKYCISDSLTDGCLGNILSITDVTYKTGKKPKCTAQRTCSELRACPLCVIQTIRGLRILFRYYRLMETLKQNIIRDKTSQRGLNTIWRRFLLRICASILEKDTPCLTASSVCRLQLKRKLRVRWRKPASQQVRFTEYDWTGLVKPKKQSFLQLLYN